MKSFLLRAACAAWFLAASAAMILPPRAAAQLQMEVRAGFSDTLVPGRWAPLELTLYNTGSARRGEVFLRVPSGQAGTALEYVERIDIPHQGRRVVQFALPLDLDTAGLMAGMRDEAGNTAAERGIDLSGHTTTEALVLALSRGPDLDFLASRQQRRTSVAYVRAEQLPARWDGLDSAEAIVVHNVPLSEIEQTRYDALLTWVRNGGVLVLAAGSSFATMQGARERELLPVRVRGVATISKLPALPNLPAVPVPEGEWTVMEAALVRGEILAEAEGLPLVARRGLGLGSVAFLAIDYTAPRLKAWRGHPALWELLLTNGTDGSGAWDSAWADTVMPHPAGELLKQPLLRAPARLGLASYVLLYGLLVAGALWAIGAGWGRGMAGWAALGAIVTVCTVGAAFWMRDPILRAEGAVLSLRTQQLHADDGLGRVVEHSGIFSARGAAANLVFRDATAVVRTTQPLGGAPADEGSSAEDVPISTVRVSREGDTLVWRGLPLPRRSAMALTTESWAPAPVTVKVARKSGSTVLSLENRSAQPVVASLVVLGGKVYETGGLRPGETHEEDFFDTAGNAADIPGGLAGLLSAQLPEHVGALGVEIPRLLIQRYFRDRPVADAAGKLIWLGWVPGDEPGVRWDGGSAHGTALTLLVAEVEL